MCGQAYDPRFLFTWPNTKSAVMGPAQLAGVLSIVSRAAAQAAGRPFDEDADAAMKAMVEAQIEAESLPTFLSGRIYDDGIIDPRDTRTVARACACRSSTARRSAAPPATACSGCEAMLTRVLVANRGEIARRVFRTCRDLGIATVAVYSDADAGSPHVAEADAAVRLPGETPADTYLRADLLIEAARAPGPTPCIPATASCRRTPPSPAPSRNPGLTWIGPPPDAIEAMGSKIESKRLMAAAACRCLPRARAGRAEPNDLPVLIKASAGGGGRGMRVVRTLAELPGGSRRHVRGRVRVRRPDGVLRAVRRAGRHIEVQILADDARHDLDGRRARVLDPAPAPEDHRGSAVAARAAAARYARPTVRGGQGGGGRDRLPQRGDRRVPGRRGWPVLLPGDEHPAAGRAPGHRVHDRPRPGRAAAADRGWAAHCPPQTRRRSRARDRGAAVRRGPRRGLAAAERDPAQVRAAGDVESGSRCRRAGQGSGWTAGVRRSRRQQVGIFYDPMLAKVISWAADRDQAAAALAAALARARIHGLTTNRDLLVRVLRHPAFLAGQTDTAFFDTHGLDTLAAPLADGAPRSCRPGGRAGRRGRAPARRAGARRAATGLAQRAVPAPARPYAGHDVGYRIDRSGLAVDGRDDVTLVSLRPDLVELDVAGIRRRSRSPPTPAWSASTLGSARSR